LNSPKEVAQQYIAIGAAKTKLPISKMLVLAIFAGLFIGLAGIASTFASATLTGSVARFLGASVFSGGLAMVIVAGSELFTGNCLLIIPVIEKQATVGGLLKNWVVVYIGNFVGALIIAALIVYGGSLSNFNNAVGATAINVAVGRVSLPFLSAFFRGILCNFLVCIAVWMAFAAKDVVGKIVGVYFPIMFFVLCNLNHSIADMGLIMTGLFGMNNPAYLEAFKAISKADPSVLTWGSMFVKNLIPVTLGNIVGGLGIVGVGYWFAYLRQGKKQDVLANKK
jgi:formate/nitrite transporter